VIGWLSGYQFFGASSNYKLHTIDLKRSFHAKEAVCIEVHMLRL